MNSLLNWIYELTVMLQVYRLVNSNIIKQNYCDILRDLMLAGCQSGAQWTKTESWENVLIIKENTSPLLTSSKRPWPHCGLITACSSPQVVLGPLIAIALKISNIHERTGRRGPNVITWTTRKTQANRHTCVYLLPQKYLYISLSCAFCSCNSVLTFEKWWPELKVLNLSEGMLMLHTVPTVFIELITWIQIFGD